MVQLILLVLSLLGLADASYLTIEHYRGVAPNCTIFNECDVVTTSQYATIFGIPIALVGALYYLSVFILGVWYVRKGSPRAVKALVFLTASGSAVSIFLIYLQLFVLKALCLYCLISASVTALLFVLSAYLYARSPKPSRVS